MKVKALVAQLFSTLCNPWAVACQTPLSMEYFSKNTGVGSHSLPQRIFLTQDSNLDLLHCRQILYHLSYHKQQYFL